MQLELELLEKEDEDDCEELELLEENELEHEDELENDELQEEKELEHEDELEDEPGSGKNNSMLVIEIEVPPKPNISIKAKSSPGSVMAISLPDV